MRTKEEIENSIGIRNYKTFILEYTLLGMIGTLPFLYIIYVLKLRYKLLCELRFVVIYVLSMIIGLLLILIGNQYYIFGRRLYSFYEDGLYITEFVKDELIGWEEFSEVKVEKHLFSKCICFKLKQGRKYRCIYSDEILYWLKIKCPLIK